jgi:MFS family permease
VLCISVLLAAIDNAIVNVALPTLNRRINASTADLQWIVAAYSLAAVLGRRRHARRLRGQPGRPSLLLRSPVRGTLVPGMAGFRPWFAGPGNRTFELVEYVP